jgi:hypothetical protein
LIQVCQAGHWVVDGINLRAQIDGYDVCTLLSEADSVTPALSTCSASNESNLAFYSIRQGVIPPS